MSVPEHEMLLTKITAITVVVAVVSSNMNIDFVVFSCLVIVLRRPILFQ